MFHAKTQASKFALRGVSTARARARVPVGAILESYDQTPNRERIFVSLRYNRAEI